jgi:Ca2+-binding RTX toxin-like protein
LPLEPRRLFATAPPTLLGVFFHVNINTGTPPLIASENYLIEIASSGREYKVVDQQNLQKSAGSYVYSIKKSNVSELTTNDSEFGTETIDFTFSTPTIGTIKLSRNAGGSQSGTFFLTGPDFATELEGRVKLAGTVDKDSFGASIVGEQVAFTRNNITQKFDLDDLFSISLNADAGDDVADFSAMTVPVYAQGGEGNDSIVGGSGKDTLSGEAGRNTLFGSDGDDRLNGSGSRDQLFGGAGNDRLYGNGNNDTLDGGGGVDRLFGGDGDDLLLGGGSNDKLYGEAGNDTLNGQGQSDLIDGGAGADSAMKDLLDSNTSIETLIG